MSQPKAIFGCCECQTASTNFLICILCQLKYHVNCVNINKRPKDLTKEFKSKWMCPGCHSKQPKSDNTNTPVRAAVAAHNVSPESSNNINTRRGAIISQNFSSEVSIDSVRKIVREELHDILETFKINILQQFDLQTKELLDSFKRVSDSLSTIEKQQESHTCQIALLESENATLRKTVSDLTTRVARIEQHSRASNLEIQNIPENKSENLFKVAQQVADVAGFKLSDSDIHLCTRVAKLNSDSLRPRSVIIKFSSPRIRDNFLAATRRFNKKANSATEKLNTSHIGIGGQRKPIFVVEHLSPSQKALHAATRIKAKELNYKFVWVKGNRIFIRKTETSEYKLIKSSEDLSQLK